MQIRASGRPLRCSSGIPAKRLHHLVRRHGQLFARAPTSLAKDTFTAWNALQQYLIISAVRRRPGRAPPAGRGTDPPHAGWRLRRRPPPAGRDS